MPGVAKSVKDRRLEEEWLYEGQASLCVYVLNVRRTRYTGAGPHRQILLLGHAHDPDHQGMIALSACISCALSSVVNF